jgi:hypothetical protein
MTETVRYVGNVTSPKQTSSQASCRREDAIALIPKQTRSLTGFATIRSRDKNAAGNVRAISTENFVFTGFNQPLVATRTATDTNSLVLSKDKDSSVSAVATANAFFGSNPIVTQNIGIGNVTTEATGKGTSFGVAEGFATVAGTFFVRAGETFSFKFSGYLKMNTSLQNAATQAANTVGRIAFGVYDVTCKPVRLDFLEVTGSLDTPGNRDFLSFQISGSNSRGNFSLNREQTSFVLHTGKLQEAASAAIVGEYKTQPFTKDTLLVLGDLATVLKPPSEISEAQKSQLNQNSSQSTSQKPRSPMENVQLSNPVV